MALESGTQLAHYEVLEAIGRGGMGEVYRARDGKLGREVAIKVLPAEFSQDVERLARLEREARMLASLNHPNIAAIYGLEESDGVRFLVLELVEGDTLAQSLTHGALPVRDSLEIARQIAEALAAAHESGVVHRDLKPANVKVTPDGTVKVLDFGLAKGFSGEQDDVNLSSSPTLSMAATRAGIILGTAAYMSPEQARGRAVDRRTDIWGFGCVMFEMLSGTRAFRGEDVSDILASVLAREPDYARLPSGLDPRVRHLLERCLEKNPKKRWQDTGDVRIEIEEILSAPAPAAGGSPDAGPPSRVLWAGGLALALMGVVVGWVVRPEPPAETRAVSRFYHELAEDQPFRNLPRKVLAISRDGSTIAYNSFSNGGDVAAGLYRRSLDDTVATLIPGTEENLTGPVFSPDGDEIAYWAVADQTLKRIGLGGGSPVDIAAVMVNPAGIDWVDDTLVYGQPDGIWSVGARGGDPVLLVASEGDSLSWPQMLPGGTTLLFSRERQGAAVVNVYSLPEKRVLLEFEGSDPRYLDTGHILFSQGDVLSAVAFDLDAMRITGGPVAFESGLYQGPLQFAVSDNGTLVYAAGVAAPADRLLALLSVDGDRRVLEGAAARPYVHPRLSPDGTRIAVQTLEDDGSSQIWVHRISGGTQIQQLTLTTEGNNSRPIWKDNETVTFTSDREDAPGLWSQRADGNEAARRLTTAPEGTEHWAGSWSSDGRTLAYTQVDNSGMAIWLLDEESGDSTEFYSLDESEEVGPEFSPDDRFLAFSSGPPQGAVVYVRNIVTGASRRISDGLAAWPLWPTQGKFFYRPLGGGATSGSTQLLGLDIVTEPEVLTKGEYDVPIGSFSTVIYYRSFDTVDGEEFLVTIPAEQEEDDARVRVRLDVVLNWTEELMERLPSP